MWHEIPAGVDALWSRLIMQRCQSFYHDHERTTLLPIDKFSVPPGERERQFILYISQPQQKAT